jgi:hypothetical protein
MICLVICDSGHTKEDSKARVAFARALMEAAPTSAFKQWPLMSPFRLVSEHRIQDKWIRGEISNFEYLMALNTISGRSFNDLCQVSRFNTNHIEYQSYLFSFILNHIVLLSIM